MLQQLNVVILPSDSDTCDSTLVIKTKTDILNTSYDLSVHQ